MTVVQQDPTGCAFASIAALAGVRYAAVKGAAEALGISVTEPSLWGGTVLVRRLLHRFGLRAAAKTEPFRTWGALPEVALLATKWHEERGIPCWHWAVFIRTPSGPSVLDSKKALRRHRRTDFGRIKPKWFWRVGPRR